MKQMSLSESGFERKTKRTRKREFLDEMNLMVPWTELVSLIAPHAPPPGAKGGRPPFGVQTMLRIHFLHSGSTCRTRPWKRRSMGSSQKKEKFVR